jgi:hypothetical protein
MEPDDTESRTEYWFVGLAISIVNLLGERPAAPGRGSRQCGALQRSVCGFDEYSTGKIFVDANNASRVAVHAR